MNHLKWAAWGVVDIEALDKHQRRNYLKKVHAEIAERDPDAKLHIGGSKHTPWYKVTVGDDRRTIAGPAAFKGICAWVLEQFGETGASPDGESDGEPDGGPEGSHEVETVA